MITPPAIGAVITSLKSNFPFNTSEKPMAVTTVAEIQYIVLIPPLEYMNRLVGISILIVGKNTQQKAAPSKARVTLNF